MTIAGALQPDQNPRAWDDHVSLYEEVFEKMTLHLALKAIEGLHLEAGASVIDSGAGAGGAALELAGLGVRVTAIDASAGMVARVKQRAALAGLPLDVRLMDGQRLEFADDSFDSALSVFGVILYPNATAGLAELRRVVRPAGRIALVTWTEPEAYELAAGLRAAAASVLGEAPAGELPAQLRFQDRARFQALFEAAGLKDVAIDTADAKLTADSASVLVRQLTFAPGMAAMLKGYGARQAAILDAFEAGLQNRFGTGPVELNAKAFIGVAEVPQRF